MNRQKENEIKIPDVEASTLQLARLREAFLSCCSKRVAHLRHLSRPDAHGGDEGDGVVDGVVGQVEHVHPHVLRVQDQRLRQRR